MALNLGTVRNRPVEEEETTIYSCVGNDWVGHVGKNSPNIAHSATELLRAAGTVYYVAFACIKTTDKCTNTCT